MMAIIGLGGGEIMVLLLLLVAVPLAIMTFVFWIWMLVSAVQNNGLSEGEKIGWVLVVALLHLLGAILYFLVGHPKRNTPLSPVT